MKKLMAYRDSKTIPAMIGHFVECNSAFRIQDIKQVFENLGAQKDKI